MNICEIIQNKKVGKALSEDEINFWIDGLFDGRVADYQSSALLMAICLKGMNEQEAFFLTNAIKNSGDVMDMSIYGNLSCDKHSSGGVGDTTSLIVVPILVANGYICGKMSGRGLGFTGGTLDKLQSVPNVNVNLSKEQFFDQVDIIGAAIAGQTSNLCPADKKLYSLRDVTATVDNIGLIAASIMSKKLASGAHNIVLDVKCGKGAFMNDIYSATELAELMVKIGKFAERNISAIITNMNLPLSRFVGNSLEILGILKVLKNEEKGDLYDVAIALSSQLMKSCGVDDAFAKAEWAVSSGEALKVFVKMMRSQGAIADFENQEEKLCNSNFCYEYLSNCSGYIEDIDALKIAKLVGNLGGGRQKIEDDIDYKVGVEIVKNQGDAVEAGQVVCKVYYSKKEQLKLCEKVADAFIISHRNVKKAKRILKIVE